MVSDVYCILFQTEMFAIIFFFSTILLLQLTYVIEPSSCRFLALECCPGVGLDLEDLQRCLCVPVGGIG